MPANPRVAVTGGGTEPSASDGGDRSYVARRLLGRELVELVTRATSGVEIASGDVCLDRHRQERQNDVVLLRACAQCSVQQFDRQVRARPREMQCCEWDHRILVVIKTGQQLLGLLETSLSHAEVGQPAPCALPDRDALGKQVERTGELVFGVLSMPRGDEDARVVRPAVPRDGQEITASHHPFGGAQPGPRRK